MTNSTETNENFIEILEEIGEAVQKWPEWKREGWAILDLKEDTSNISCGSFHENGAETFPSSIGKDKSPKLMV